MSWKTLRSSPDPLDSTVIGPAGDSSEPPISESYLTIFSARSATVYRLPEGPAAVEIGRNKDCQINLDQEPLASRSHARIMVHAEDAFLSDCGSQNGTFVNGQRLRGDRMLLSGDDRAVKAHHPMYLPPCQIGRTIPHVVS